MSKIDIKCPNCKEPFKVGAELMGETIECGVCDTQFELNSSHSMNGDKSLDRFTRSTPEIIKDEVASVRAKAYHKQVDVTYVMPLSPVHILAIVLGVLIPLIVILVFVLGSGETGLLVDLTTQNRWVLVGFLSLLSVLMLTFGFFKNRVVGALLAAIAAVSMLMMPVVYPEREMELVDDADGSGSKVLSAEEALAFYKDEIGYQVIQSKIDTAADPRDVVCVALQGVKPVHVSAIKSYLRQVMPESSYPNEYDGRRINGQSATLLLYAQAKMSLDDVAKVAQRFALSLKLNHDLRIVEVKVNTDLFEEVATSVLIDETNSEYYKANLAELRSLDHSRQHAAILRLSLCSKVSLRSDIEKELLTLFRMKGYPHKEAIVNTLILWASDDGKADAEVQKWARVLREEKLDLPMSVLNYSVQRNLAEVSDLLLYVWLKDPILHESTLIKAKAVSEQALLPGLQSMSRSQLISASRVLAKVGSEKSLDVLSILHEQSTDELKKSLKATIDEIESRR